jgi:hypothetical protein
MATVSLPAIESSYFFETLSRRHRGVLVIDYDSTIARLGSADRVFPYPTIQELIDCIVASTGTRVVLASERPAEELRGLFAPPGPEICTPDTALALERFGGSYPLAYLRGDSRRAKVALADRLQVYPQYQVGTVRAAATAVDLVQFLADWLHACTGEVC